MFVRRSPLGADAKVLEVTAPAKLNLFLEVLGKRDDGFHEIETLMLPVSLYDSLSIRSRDDGQVVLSSHEVKRQDASSEAMPQGDSNLVVRALRLLKQRAGVERGAEVTLTKRIPMAAGLAGGSSDAAA
ncbi:MAG TPA: hypothetical protein VHV77_01060, partial [Pirellulales bacterium]|nr:hypothetical protein [Pirellulales bacterium]